MKPFWYDLIDPYAVWPDVNRPVYAVVEHVETNEPPIVAKLKRVWNGLNHIRQFDWHRLEYDTETQDALVQPQYKVALWRYVEK